MDKDYLPIKILHDFVEKIEPLGISYMLTGSMAMIHYSVYRMTADIDVIIELASNDAQKMIEVFEPDYYIQHNVMKRAISTESMFNIIHQNTAFKVDCIVKKTSDFQLNAFARRRRTDFYGKDIWIISQDDLIVSKLWWAKDSLSEKQLNDVKNLMRNDFDTAYIENSTKELGVFDLYEKCRKEIEK